MKIYIQWSVDPAFPWEAVDSSEWKNLPKKIAPPTRRRPIFNLEREEKKYKEKIPKLKFYEVTGFKADNDIIDNAKGWINGLNVYGVGMISDHYALEEHFNYLSTTVWYNDPLDFEFDMFRAQERHFYPDGLQTVQIWGGPRIVTMYKNCVDDKGPIVVQPWEAFVYPAEEITRHGIWVSDTLIKQLNAFPKPSIRDWFK